jgi:hypothetical protein
MARKLSDKQMAEFRMYLKNRYTEKVNLFSIVKNLKTPIYLEMFENILQFQQSKICFWKNES